MKNLERNNKIAADFLSGVPVRELGLLNNISHQRICQILARYDLKRKDGGVYVKPKSPKYLERVKAHHENPEPWLMKLAEEAEKSGLSQTCKRIGFSPTHVSLVYTNKAKPSKNLEYIVKIKLMGLDPANIETPQKRELPVGVHPYKKNGTYMVRVGSRTVGYRKTVEEAKLLREVTLKSIENTERFKKDL